MLSLAITAAAALTAVGDDVDQTCSSIRAGIKGFSQHAFFETEARDPEWDDPQPLIAAPAPGIDPMREAPHRLADLLLPVLADLMRRARLERRHLAECALLLALPEADPVTERWSLERGLLAELTARSGLSFARVKTSRAGRPGMLCLLPEAARLFAARAASRVILAGVDSYLTEERLSYLDGLYRLKSPRNVDGFIPGEAASALLLMPATRVEPRNTPILGVFNSMGQADEPQPFTLEPGSGAEGGGRRPGGQSVPLQSTGRGLCGALRPALAQPAGWIACDLNGESYRAFEWGVAMARLGGELGPAARLVHPAIHHGDIGAATAGVLAASVLAGFQRGYAPAGDAVIWAASDGPTRAAARIARA